MITNAPRFFGYGSLVNCATHPYPNPRPETLKGWRRHWVPTSARPIAFLSARPDPDCELQGLSADVPGADWAALDERERHYERRQPADLGGDVWVYAVPDHSAVAADGHVILRSYLDVVVQGYLHVFGPDGVARFFETTSGWHIPILDDRAAPQYPRHQVLNAEETALVDQHLDRLRPKT